MDGLETSDVPSGASYLHRVAEKRIIKVAYAA